MVRKKNPASAKDAVAPAYEGRNGFITGGRRRQVAAAAAVPMATNVVQLPVLHGSASPVPGTMLPSGHVVPYRSAGGAVVAARVAGECARLSWRYRWQLSPLGLSVAVVTGAAVSPAGTAAMTMTAALAATAVVQYAPERIAGRAWLSARERGTAAVGLGGLSLWSLGSQIGWIHVDPVGVLALVALIGGQSFAWCTSRRARPRPLVDEDMSAPAAALIAAWPWTIAQNGPAPLLGSRIVAETMAEAAPGAYAFSVELADSVHGEQAVGEDLRRHLERALRLPVGTVALGIDRDDSGRLLVTMTPSRHLEGTPAPWAGPVLHEDGSIPLALARDGSQVCVALHNEAGVEHGAIFGTTGTGKSNTLVTLVLPGIMAGREVLWYLDGGQGTSAGHLAGACDVWAVEGVEQWREAIRAAHAVMRARKDSRAARGLSAWRGAAESDPVLTLVLDEATTILAALGRDKGPVEMVMEMLREGRKLGVRVIQITQDPMGDDLIGGRKARGLMAGGGSLIAHRPGDGTANTLSTGSSAQAVDLRALPPEEGWTAIIRRGQILSPVCRVAYASEDAVLALLAGFTPRGLVGQDAASAGRMYGDRVRGVQAAAQMRAAQDGTDAINVLDVVDDYDNLSDVQDDVTAEFDGVDELGDPDQGGLPSGMLSASQRMAAARGEANRVSILMALRAAAKPLGRADLTAVTALSPATVTRALNALREAGEVTQPAGTRVWAAVTDAAAA